MRVCNRPSRALQRLLASLAIAVAACAVPASAQEPAVDLEATRDRRDPEVELDGMTYVSSRGENNDMVVDARHARILPEQEVAYLKEVRIRMIASGGGDGGLDMVCEQGTFDFASGDFVAEGDVRGTTGDGRRFRTDRVRYRHEDGLVTTDDPVVIRDATGTYRGGGFRYYLEENRFRILGGATVVQEQG